MSKFLMVVLSIFSVGAYAQKTAIAPVDFQTEQLQTKMDFPTRVLELKNKVLIFGAKNLPNEKSIPVIYSVDKSSRRLTSTARQIVGAFPWDNIVDAASSSKQDKLFLISTMSTNMYNGDVLVETDLNGQIVRTLNFINHPYAPADATKLTSVDKLKNPRPVRVGVDAKGRILVMVYVQGDSPLDDGDTLILRLKPDFSMDDSFGTSGYVKLSPYRRPGRDLEPVGIASRKDGSIVVALSTGEKLFNFRSTVVILSEDGAELSKQDLNKFKPRAMAVSNSGQVAIVGTQEGFMSKSIAAALFDQNGKLTSDFKTRSISSPIEMVSGIGQSIFFDEQHKQLVFSGYLYDNHYGPERDKPSRGVIVASFNMDGTSAYAFSKENAAIIDDEIDHVVGLAQFSNGDVFVIGGKYDDAQFVSKHTVWKDVKFVENSPGTEFTEWGLNLFKTISVERLK